MMKKTISLMLALLLAVGCAVSFSGCNLMRPYQRFEAAAEDLVNFFTEFARTDALLPDVSKHTAVEGSFTASMGADSADSDFSGAFQFNGTDGSSRVDMTLPLTLMGVDGTAKMDLIMVQKPDGTRLVYFPNATDYVMQQAGSAPQVSEDRLAGAAEQLKQAFLATATKENVSALNVTRTVAGEKVETDCLTLTVLSASDTILIDSLEKALDILKLGQLAEVAENAETLTVSLYAVEGNTVYTEITFDGKDGGCHTLTLTTEETETGAEWILSLTAHGYGGNTTLFTATGDRRHHDEGTTWSYETLTADGSVMRVSMTVSYNAEDGAFKMDGTYYTSVPGEEGPVELNLPVQINGLLSEDRFRGTVALTMGTGDAAQTLTAEADILFVDSVNIHWNEPEADFAVTDTDALENTAKYQSMLTGLYHRYPELMKGTSNKPETPTPSVPDSFMLVNSDSSEMYMFYSNNTGIRRMVLGYTEKNNVISATDVDGNTISFSYNPNLTEQTVVINGANYKYSVVEGDVTLSSDKAWTDIVLSGEGMMLVDHYFNYMISGNTLSTFSGLDKAPVDHTFTKDGQFYYIDGNPYSFAEMEDA